MPLHNLTGQTIANGKYAVTRLIGRGGGGAVYEARQTTLDKKVALKVLDPELAHDDTLVKRFLREARTATRVEHENVVQLFDLGSTGTGTAYIAMELLKGEPLSDLIVREGPLPWRRTKTIALQICRAMHVAHAASVIHRDLKPDNCFRIKRGANADFIKLLDFGLAKVFGDATNPFGSLSHVGTTFGTPEYMAPEQCEGEGVDHRVDIYALGIIVYELLTGTVPFPLEGNNFIDVLDGHVERAPVPPSALVGEDRVTREMDAFVLRALAKDPDERFFSMKQMAEALLHVREPLATSSNHSTGETTAGLGIDVGTLTASTSGRVRPGSVEPPPARWLDRPNAKLALALAISNLLLAVALLLALAN